MVNSQNCGSSLTPIGVVDNRDRYALNPTKKDEKWKLTTFLPTSRKRTLNGEKFFAEHATVKWTESILTNSKNTRNSR